MNQNGRQITPRALRWVQFAQCRDGCIAIKIRFTCTDMADQDIQHSTRIGAHETVSSPVVYKRKSVKTIERDRQRLNTWKSKPIEKSSGVTTRSKSIKSVDNVDCEPENDRSPVSSIESPRVNQSSNSRVTVFMTDFSGIVYPGETESISSPNTIHNDIEPGSDENEDLFDVMNSPKNEVSETVSDKSYSASGRSNAANQKPHSKSSASRSLRNLEDRLCSDSFIEEQRKVLTPSRPASKWSL